MSDTAKVRYAVLRYLPEDNPLRTKPLHSIGAQYKNMKSCLGWIPATAEKLGEFSFNDLDAQWAEFNEWRAPRSGAANPANPIGNLPKDD